MRPSADWANGSPAGSCRVCTVRVNGQQLRRGSVPAAVKAGLGLAPEERKSQGLLLDQAIYKNVTVSALGLFARLGFLDSREERRRATAA